MFAPLYFLFYPIGLLPETVLYFELYPWLGWFAAFVTLLILGLIYREARRPAILFGLLAMAVVRLHPDTRPIDPIHLVGGGQLLIANAFFAVALIALFVRIMDHPKWRLPMVTLTTLVALVSFILQIQANWLWRNAGDRVHEFQKAAHDLHKQHPHQVIGVLPDLQYVGGAPAEFSRSVSYDTAFSSRLPIVSLLPLNLRRDGDLAVTMNSWSERGGLVSVGVVEPAQVLYLFPFYQVNGVGGGTLPVFALLAQPGVQPSNATVSISLPGSSPTSSTEDGSTLRAWLSRSRKEAPRSLPVEIAPAHGELPILLLPGPTVSTRKEPP
jgi:hypothetical protein